MNLNFSNLKVIESTNTKVSTAGKAIGQSYNFRFKAFTSHKKNEEGVVEDKPESFFQISNALFEKLGLDDKAMIQVVDNGTSYLAVVDNDNGTVFKATAKNKAGEKGKKFKSSIIEAALAGEGLIDPSLLDKSQKLELTLVEGSENQMLGGKILTYGVYAISKSEDTSGDADDKVATPEVDSTVGQGNVSPVEEAPAVEPEHNDAPQAQEGATEIAETPVVPETPAAAPASDDEF